MRRDRGVQRRRRDEPQELPAEKEMSLRWLCLGGALLSALVGACRHSGVSVPPDARGEPVAVLPVPASSMPSSGAPGPAVLEPPLPPFERGMMDHVERAGWSPDGSEFGYCVTSGGSGATNCTFATV